MNRRSFPIIALVATLVVTLAGGCAVGPDYERPPAPVPAAYKEEAGWKPSEPRDVLDRGAWWSIYKDPVLDGLEKRIEISNQSLKASEAAYRQARAVVDQARSSFFPTLTGDATQQRSQSGQGQSGTRPSGFSVSGGAPRNQYGVSLGASWEPDIWGRIRRTVESDVANAQASAADLAGARLSLQATLAADYFELRAQEELQRLLDTTVQRYMQSLQITQNRYRAGVAAKADVLTAQTQLMNTQAQAINAGVLRAQLEHAIAVLTGEPPANFSIAPGPLAAEVPTVPAGIPSTLLERRPDIASAERRMASANAQIGVAIAAFFPNITLSGSYGYSGSAIGNLISASNRLWSFGSTVAETIFDAGARSAQLDQARALYDENVATYRQTVLTSFQQVEDQMAGLRILTDQAAVEEDVVRTAQEAERLTLNQYKAGTVPYSSVITAQATTLTTQQTALGVQRDRLTASVTLIQALGGGWDSHQLPNRDQVEDSDAPMPVAVRNTPPAGSP